MMEREDGNDREIRELFEHARRADRSIAPGFDALIAAKPRRARSFRVGRYVSLALASTLAIATWLVLRTSSTLEPGRVREVDKEKPVELAAQAPAPVAPPAPEPVVTSKDLREKLKGLGYIAGAVGGVDAAKREDVYAYNENPTSGLAMNSINPDSIEEIDVVTAGRDATNVSKASRLRSAGDEAEAPDFNTETYAPIRDNELQSARDNPLSTFSIDVDTASYSNVRRYLKQGTFPPRDAVRVEEMVNYFPYDYPAASGDAPFSASVEIASCPWNNSHRLARIGLKGREIERGATKGSNLVFLIDVSGSMEEANKLPLVQKSLALLVNELDGRDDVAIVVYAGASGVVLPPSPGSAKADIRAALDRLQAGGGTNGGEGLALAYKLAREHFIAGGVNRVILATDGDFNLGITSQAELLSLIETDARKGIFLTVLGFGMGNYKDATLELLADKGNGNYAYIDDLREARKVLVEQIGGTLVTIAKDVKIQVEFNPAQVASYRLVGYENRLLHKEDFNDDRKDAGEIGAGHTVTALYEIVSAGSNDEPTPPVDPLKYQAEPAVTYAAGSGELFTLKLRYKEPEDDTSRLLSFPVTDGGHALEQASTDFMFAAAVADFGLVLRKGSRDNGSDLDRVRSLARAGVGADAGGYRAEFLELVGRAERAR